LRDEFEFLPDDWLLGEFLDLGSLSRADSYYIRGLDALPRDQM